MPASVLVGKPSDIPPGDSVVVSVGKRTIAVFHHEGGFFAIDDCCPHAGASLAGGHVEGGVVTCGDSGGGERTRTVDPTLRMSLGAFV